MSAPRKPDYPVDGLFTQRWSPRAFTGEAIDESTLLTFFEAARWAPSGFNAQPWRFIYGRRATAAWIPIFESLLPFNKEWAQHASALVVVLSITQWVPPGKADPQPISSHAFDTGAAWASLAFQAHLDGWQTHGMGGFDRDVARRGLGIPEDHALHAIIAIGRRGDKAALSEALRSREYPSDRRPLHALVSEGRFAFPA